MHGDRPPLDPHRRDHSDEQDQEPERDEPGDRGPTRASPHHHHLGALAFGRSAIGSH